MSPLAHDHNDNAPYVPFHPSSPQPALLSPNPTLSHPISTHPSSSRIIIHHIAPRPLASPFAYDIPPILLSPTPANTSHHTTSIPLTTGIDDANPNPPYTSLSANREEGCPSATPSPPSENESDPFGLGEYLATGTLPEFPRSPQRQHGAPLSYPEKLANYTTQLKEHKLRRAQADLSIRRASIQETDIYFYYNIINSILANKDIPHASPIRIRANRIAPVFDTMIENLIDASEDLSSLDQRLDSLAPIPPDSTRCPSTPRDTLRRTNRSIATFSDINARAEEIWETRSSPSISLARSLAATPWPLPHIQDLSGDARRTGQEQGAKPQCALAAIRNVTRNPHICNDTLTLFPHDLGRGWEGKDSNPRLSNRNESITRIPWVKLLEFITLPSEERVWRAACEVVSRLEDKLISYINRAIIPENRGRGPATHVTVIIRDHLNTLQPSWHYLDNDASPFPQPRPLFSTNLTAGQVRNKVRENRSVIYITTATHSPLDLGPGHLFDPKPKVIRFHHSLPI